MISVADHLWQSTLFALGAGALTLLLRKNRAQSRYDLWLIASVKFLIPFSALIAIGARLGLTPARAIPSPVFAYAIQGISQPFALPTGPATGPSYAPALLLAVWLGGCVAILVRWWMRWRKVGAVVRTAGRIERGREIEALNRLKARMGIGSEIRLAACAAQLEPGVFGVWRPVISLPAGIAERLSGPELDAVIAHELCHVRRRDNLTSIAHMAVEAVFWFHPLVWWMGARLLDERERACDEAVLELGGEPQIYAGSILKVCEFYLESPLECVAGVTGSDLKKRMERIMSNRIGSRLGLWRKLLLATLGVTAVLGPVTIGLMNAPRVRAQGAGGISGAWSGVGRETGGKGGPIQLNLEQKGSEITGFIGTPKGQLPILNGRMDGATLRFEVSSQPKPIQFALRWNNDHIQGTGSDAESRPWIELDLTKASIPGLDNIGGAWRGAFTMSGPVEPRTKAPALLHLKQNGSEITGSIGMDEAHQAPILNGRISGDVIRFDHDANELRVSFELRLDNGWLNGNITGTDHGAPFRAELDAAKFAE